MLEENTKRIAGYVWFCEDAPPEPNVWRHFFEQYFTAPRPNKIEIVEVFTDYGKPKSVSKRAGWNQLLEAKKQGMFDVICIPSIRLLSPYPQDAFSIAQELSSGPYPVEVLFLCEDLHSSHPDFRTVFSLHLAAEDHIQKVKKKERDIKKFLKEIQTSLAISAELPKC